MKPCRKGITEGLRRDASENRAKFGALELLAALGLVLPLLVGVLRGLTAWPAAGLVAIMIGAAVTHARRKEPQVIGFNVVLLALAAFVAIGRFTIGT